MLLKKPIRNCGGRGEGKRKSILVKSDAEKLVQRCRNVITWYLGRKRIGSFRNFANRLGALRGIEDLLKWLILNI